ncbi:type II toxin-antitoxin system VapC family toxin [Homoserinimonas sp. A520]
MKENAYLVDSAVVVYALGADSPWRQSCRRLLVQAGQQHFRAYASVEMVQELVHHRLRRSGDRAASAQQGRYVSSLFTLLNFDREVLDLSLDLIERLPMIRGRDAAHAATALAYGIDTIVSPDRAFDGIPSITRLDPSDLA